VSEADPLLMSRIDELHMEFPFAGMRGVVLRSTYRHEYV
jgi:hypothetical protein